MDLEKDDLDEIEEKSAILPLATRGEPLSVRGFPVYSLPEGNRVCTFQQIPFNLFPSEAYHCQRTMRTLTAFVHMEQLTKEPLQNFSEILKRCLRGDTSAFREIVREFQEYVFSIALRVLCNEEDANDVVQESFIRVWNNLSRYDSAVKFSTWLYAIVTNLCYDRLRVRKRNRSRTLDDVDASLLASIATEHNPEQLYTNKEIAKMISLLTEELPPKQKLVFVLRDLEGLNVREVCGILNLSESSVKTNLVYARRYLRQHLEPFISE